ncbi:Rv2578c family radical SAM protein [Phytoactinopolyspora halotolerans]|uniref:Radical SAM protein n=1 Tax=Phytoactinopolyspora halotolerans TaxID=1981512 RepID=A0A6L9S2Y3_9ACTN|nr:Rv2578c family radical SAM protein [Phytoactinopolyspora halotolerans]NED99408.1 radical SAM protein [Phytoactinopolyspora halotolerans]
MRWETQALDTEVYEALPGLQRIPGLVRSVTTPEFAGVTFHEVAARSVLNKVPATSEVPFRWTVNPYRGCTHACTYCLAGDTPILMADGRAKRLDQLRAGDRIYGTRRQGARRRYVPTEVVAHWQTIKPAYRIELADGTRLVASGDHRFLTNRGWKHVTGSGPGGRRRPHLTVRSQMSGIGKDAFGRVQQIDGAAVASHPTLRVVSVEPLGRAVPMHDITTGTGDFIANGVVSHNCFARGSHEWLELDPGQGFDTEIVVKVNAPDVLAREVARRSWSREHVALGTNTDPYQRAEGRYRLMPGIIKALAGSGTPFSILTKGPLLKRDIPLLVDAASTVDIGMAVSIAILDEELHRSMEPGTPSPRARLDLVRAIREAGFDCSVLLAPVLPWLTDSAEQLETTVAALAEAGASRVAMIPLHLRPGTRPWFMQWLRRERPDLVSRYEWLYKRGAYVPPEYKSALKSRIEPILERHGVNQSWRTHRDAGHTDGGGGVRDGDAAAPPTWNEQLSLI